MKLRIIGKTKDDKGTQLELLTRVLLENKGYDNITTNFIASGGSEIDVAAEYEVPSLGDVQKYKVICECKAHDSSIGMTEWLKFLGKIYCEETKCNSMVYGYFIPLSGVNGNVSGSYEELLEHKRKNISLIRGKELIKQLNQIFKITELKNIVDIIENHTNRKRTSINLCYYSNCLYWLVEFENNVFTLLNADGTQFDSKSNDEVINIIEKNTASGKFINLLKEYEAIQHDRLKKKILVTCLILNNGKMQKGDILPFWKKHHTTDDLPLLDEKEIDNLVIKLVAEKIIFDNAGKELCLFPQNDKDEYDYFNLYRFLFNYGLIIYAVGSSFYDQNINKALLKRICDIQEKIQIPDELKNDCLVMLRWSPSALAWALKSDPMIVNSRKKVQNISQQIEEHHTEYFFNQLQQHLINDYQNKAFTEYFYKKRNIREIETNRILKVKSSGEVLAQFALKQRKGIGELAPSLGGGYIQLLILNKAPELWE